MPAGIDPTTEPLRCAGDHRAMGEAQGAARAAELRALPAMLLDMLAAARPRGRKLEPLAPSLTAAASLAAHALLSRHLEQHYPDQAARLAGIAAGAGVSVRQLLVAPAVELLLNTVSHRAPAACTAVAVSGARSATGEAVIVKNFDYPDGARWSYLARLSEPATGPRSLDVTNSPLAGSHEGINEHGLAIAYNYGHFSGRARARVSITTLVQALLESCQTVEQAIDMIRERPRAGGALLMLADAAGDIASVEVAPDAIGVRRGRDHDDALAHTNHAQSEAIRPRDVPLDAVFSRWYPPDVRGTRVQASSQARLARAASLLADRAPLGDAALRAIAADHGGGPGSDLTVCRHGPFYTTTCSVLLYPRQRAVALAFGPPCETPYRVLSL